MTLPSDTDPGGGASRSIPVGCIAFWRWPAATAISFAYVGNRIKGTVGGVTTVYIAGIYEWQNGATTKYYEGVAIRRSGYTGDNGVFYTLTDHLRSTSVLVNQNGTVNSRNYYYPYGGNRGGSAFSGLTTKRFTGQYHEQCLPAIALDMYHASIVTLRAPPPRPSSCGCR